MPEDMDTVSFERDLSKIRRERIVRQHTNITVPVRRSDGSIGETRTSACRCGVDMYASALTDQEGFTVTHDASRHMLSGEPHRPGFHTWEGAMVAAYRVSLIPAEWHKKDPFKGLESRTGRLVKERITETMNRTAEEELLWLSIEDVKNPPTETLRVP